MWREGVRIDIPPLPGAGMILDLCCGGEGVIARSFPGRVIGVDQSLSEIRECRSQCPPETIFLVGDATHTQFINQSFGVITAFFGLMYLREEAKGALFREVARLLKPAGVFWLWDANIPDGREAFTLPVEVCLPTGETIRTGYGCKGPTAGQSLATARGLAAAAGLISRSGEDYGAWFCASFTTPTLP